MSGIMSMLLGAVSSAAAAADEFFNRVTLLLNTGSTNGAQNNTFLDSSTANSGSGWTITRNGNTTQGTFTPFSQTGWSNYFDGTDDYLAIADNALLRFGAGAFTLEAWIWRNASGAAHTIYAKGGASTGIVFQVTSTNVLRFTHTTTNIDSTGTIAANSWTHVAVVREGTGANQTKLYINGTQDGQGTVSTDFTQTEEVRIGTDRGATADFNGYISNLRFVKGTALYTTTFTPSTTPLTTTSQGATATEVELLTCQSNRFLDNSSNAFPITITGTPSVQAFSPFAPTAAYDSAVVGGSGYFDGSGDYLQNPASASNGLGTGNYTLECWFYLNSAPASGSDRTFIRYHWTGSAGQNAVYYLSVINSAGTLYPYTFARDVTTPANNTTITSSTAIRLSTWNHVAAVRSGTTLTLYLNGVSVGSATGVSWNLTAGTNIPIYIGTYNGSSEMMDGYISGARVVKSAVYSGSTYTIPTAPPTSDVNTQLLLNYTNAGIFDAAAKNNLETVGNAQVSTTQAKFGTTSMYFDGTGDYITIPNSPIVNLSGDFTIEAWVYRVTTGANTNIICVGSFGAAANGFTFYISSTNYLAIYGNNAVIAIGATTTIPANTWTYVAAVRSGTATNNLKLYVNGTLEVQTTNNTSFVGVAGNGMCIGADYSGSAFTATASCYIDELRLTRYARTITTPTAAFPTQ